MRRRRPPPRDIPITKSIVQFFHCGLCIEEVKVLAERYGTASPREYARHEIGWTELGLQVWCVRHNVNLIHIDFEGHQHPANMDRLDPEDGNEEKA